MLWALLYALSKKVFCPTNHDPSVPYPFNLHTEDV